MGTNVIVILNGEKLAKVTENSQIAVKLPDERAYLKIRHSGVKSNEIEVRDGDVIEIKKKKWYKWSYPLFMMIIFLSLLFPGLANKIIFIVVIGLIFISSFYFIDGYYLKATNR